MNKAQSAKPWVKRVQWRTYTMVFALIIVAIFFQMITHGIFFAPRNLSNLMRAMSITGVIAVGTVLMIVSGNFDLAVGSIVGLSGGIAAILQVNHDVSTPVAMLAALMVGAAIGIWQGFWVAYRKVPSFIVTLGGQMVFRGLYLVITSGITITPMHKSFTIIAQGFIPNAVGIVLGVIAIIACIILTLRNRAIKAKYESDVGPVWITILKIILFSGLFAAFVLIMNGYKGIPIPVLIFVALIGLFTFISTKTRFGRNVYAIGGNLEAARLCGINVRMHVLILYVITGLLSGVSGILLTGRMDGATSSAGTSFEMDAISACVLGGTSLAGGKGSIIGAIIGALIIASLDNGMSLLSLSYNYQSIVKGLVLILAVWFDVANQKNK